MKMLIYLEFPTCPDFANNSRGSVFIYYDTLGHIDRDIASFICRSERYFKFNYNVANQAEYIIIARYFGSLIASIFLNQRESLMAMKIKSKLCER